MIADARGNALLTRKVQPKFVLIWTLLTFLFGIIRCSCNCLFSVERNRSTVCARRGLKCNYTTYKRRIDCFIIKSIKIKSRRHFAFVIKLLTYNEILRISWYLRVFHNLADVLETCLLERCIFNYSCSAVGKVVYCSSTCNRARTQFTFRIFFSIILVVGGQDSAQVLRVGFLSWEISIRLLFRLRTSVSSAWNVRLSWCAYMYIIHTYIHIDGPVPRRIFHLLIVDFRWRTTKVIPAAKCVAELIVVNREMTIRAYTFQTDYHTTSYT